MWSLTASSACVACALATGIDTRRIFLTKRLGAFATDCTPTSVGSPPSCCAGMQPTPRRSAAAAAATSPTTAARSLLRVSASGQSIFFYANNTSRLMLRVGSCDTRCFVPVNRSSAVNCCSLHGAPAPGGLPRPCCAAAEPAWRQTFGCQVADEPDKICTSERECGLVIPIHFKTFTK